MASSFRDAGIHTVEGTVSGRRASELAVQRSLNEREFEEKKATLQEETSRGMAPIDERFSRATGGNPQISQRTMGLLTLEEFRRAKLQDENPDPESKPSAEALVEAARREEEKRKKKEAELKKRKMQQKCALSFGDEEEEEEEEIFPQRKRVNKCPHVETDFLPDANRERNENEERARLKEEWLTLQEKIKQEPLDVTFSHWDGVSRGRRSVTVKKGDTVENFLEKARHGALKTISTANLLFVKDDFILSHHLTFYDLLLITKTTTKNTNHHDDHKQQQKTTNLFQFHVDPNITLPANSSNSVITEASHPGKLVTRAWYDSNKHIFPASKWVLYQPSSVVKQEVE